MGFEKHNPIHHRWRVGKAFTILEVLLAILLSCLVGLVLYQMFYTQDRTYTIQSDISELQQNLRVATEAISRDLAMAGFAQPPWTTINEESNIDFSGIRITGGSVVDIVGSFDGAQGILSQPVAAGSIEIKLCSGGGENFKGKSKIDINIGGKENARITYKDGNKLTIDTDPNTPGEQGMKFEYRAGTEVYLVKRKTYWVDDSNRNQPLLRVDEHLGAGGQQLALFITGMEITLSGRMAEITITGRTRNPDRTTGLYTVAKIGSKTMLRNLP